MAWPSLPTLTQTNTISDLARPIATEALVPTQRGGVGPKPDNKWGMWLW